MSAKAFSRQARLNVVAESTKKIKYSASVKMTKPTKAKGSNNLAVLAKIADLGLLSKVEELGLLSKLEKAGFTLSKIESAGLLSFAEKSGVLSLVADDSTPGNLNLLGTALLAAAFGLVLAVPDESTATVLVQALGGTVLAAGGIAALTGGSILSKIQKL